MSTDQDEEIPVLTEAVRRRGKDLTSEQIDEICDSLAAEAWVMLDGLIAESLRAVEEELRIKINDRLGDELPQLIEKTLHEKLGDPPED